MSNKKYVYLFSEGKAEMRNLLGGKGANLAEMTNIGLPAPPGLIITTEACKEFYAQGLKFPPGMEDQRENLGMIEKIIGKKLGDPAIPLLVSVRSGAPVWMTGMMDTVLNLVYGNMGTDCGTGVAFTRNPVTGENKVYGEYLINAQGEDVVAGIRTPLPISSLAGEMPDIYRQFEDTCRLLEKHYRNMQDIEFTIEHGKLYILQTRAGKRTAQAAVKVAVDMANEGLISMEEAITKEVGRV